MNYEKHKLVHLCVALLFFATFAEAKQVLIVSPKGNDKGRGSLYSPFATVERALSEAARYAGDSVEIRIREGMYPLGRTIDVKGYSNLLIAPYQGEKVSFTGSIKLQPKHLRPVSEPEVSGRLQPEVRKQVREINLQELGYTLTGLTPKGFGRPALPSWSELFINGQPQHIARWPNDSTVLIGKVHCTGDIPREQKYGLGDPVFEYAEQRPSEWKSVEDAWIAGYFAYGYADDLLPVKAIDPERKTVTAAQATLYGFKTDAPFRRWYALNLVEEIDLPGEYVIDRKRGKIYLLPPDEPVREIQVSLLGTPLFAFEGCRNVTLQGVTLEYSRGMGVYIEQSEYTKVDSCVIRNLGYVGVSIGRGDMPADDLSEPRHSADLSNPEGVPAVIGNLSSRLYDDRLFDRKAGRYNGVSNCLLYQLGSGGVSVGGGQRATLTPAFNYVENCRIYNFNRIERSYRAGVSLDGVGNKASHCEIYDAPSMAILLNGNDHIIEYCDIHHVCQEVDDQGAIYYGRDPSERGMLVRYCYLHHMKSEHRVSATYHDDGACGMEVFGCLYYKAGTIPVLIGGGHDNIYKNNIFVDVPQAFHIDNRMEGWSKATMDKGGIFEQRLNTVHYDQPPYVTAYPLLAGYWENNPRIPRGNQISSNLFFQVKRILNGQPAWAEWSNNYITNLNPGFKDPDDPIKGFLPDAAVYKYIYDFSPLPFEEMGCSLPEDWSQRSYQAGPVDMEVVQRGDSEFPVGFSAFSLESHFVWCGSAIRAEEDGRYYLFYSAMESGTGHPPFVDAWLLGSKIGVAVSDSPYGGYKNIGFVYNKDGYTPDRSSWDAQTVSNTHIKRFNGKYYLYYCGSVDPGENARIKGTLSKRDRIQQNQKLGVLCFNSIKELLEGKYTCNEQPLLIPRSRVKPNNVLEPSPEGTAVKPDNLIMVNPAVVYCPANRKYFLYFKGNVYDPGWRGVHGVAISDEPAGPFRVLDDNVFEFETGTDQKLNAEDPYVWYHRKDRCFYAVFKDFTGGFTQGKPGLAIMYSKDGLHWELPEHSLFMNKEIILKNGEHVDVDRLERPQLFLDENDDPIVLYSACSITPLNQKKDGSSFNIQIPVLCSSGNPVTCFSR